MRLSRVFVGIVALAIGFTSNVASDEEPKKKHPFAVTQDEVYRPSSVKALDELFRTSTAGPDDLQSQWSSAGEAAFAKYAAAAGEYLALFAEKEKRLDRIYGDFKYAGKNLEGAQIDLKPMEWVKFHSQYFLRMVRTAGPRLSWLAGFMRLELKHLGLNLTHGPPWMLEIMKRLIETDREFKRLADAIANARTLDELADLGSDVVVLKSKLTATTMAIIKYQKKAKSYMERKKPSKVLDDDLKYVRIQLMAPDLLKNIDRHFSGPATSWVKHLDALAKDYRKMYEGVQKMWAPVMNLTFYSGVDTFSGLKPHEFVTPFENVRQLVEHRQGILEEHAELVKDVEALKKKTDERTKEIAASLGAIDRTNYDKILDLAATAPASVKSEVKSLASEIQPYFERHIINSKLEALLGKDDFQLDPLLHAVRSAPNNPAERVKLMERYRKLRAYQDSKITRWNKNLQRLQQMKIANLSKAKTLIQDAHGGP